MPPHSRIRPLRPCFQTRRAIDPRRRLLSTKRPDSSNPDHEPQTKNASDASETRTEPAKGWWGLIPEILTPASWRTPTPASESVRLDPKELETPTVPVVSAPPAVPAVPTTNPPSEGLLPSEAPNDNVVANVDAEDAAVLKKQEPRSLTPKQYQRKVRKYIDKGKFTATENLKLVRDSLEELEAMPSPAITPLTRAFAASLLVFDAHIKGLFGRGMDELRYKGDNFKDEGVSKAKRVAITESLSTDSESTFSPPEMQTIKPPKLEKGFEEPLREITKKIVEEPFKKITEKIEKEEKGFDEPFKKVTEKIEREPFKDSYRLLQKSQTKAPVGPSSQAPVLQKPATAPKGTVAQSPQVPALQKQEVASKEAVTLDNTSSGVSLLEELFPEAGSYRQPQNTRRNPYPKLELPTDVPLVKPVLVGPRKSQREVMIERFQQRSEPLTALQIVHCSTELTEDDFRLLLPKGAHIDSWVRDGEFHKVIPGRDPVTLERLPFYYIVFKSPASALAYQTNVGRLHKLVGLYQASSMMSAIPPPVGLLEKGQDLQKILSQYLISPASLKLKLNMVMQPYNPSLRTLIEQGGYKPIVPSVSENGKPLWKVLLHIQGWEPTRQDLYNIFARHAYDSGLTWPFHNGELAIHKLRDIVDLRAKIKPVSDFNPHASTKMSDQALNQFPAASALDSSAPDGYGKGDTPPNILNRVYNRWIVEFEEEEAARRFARMWHRRLLIPKIRNWKDVEEPRMVNTEFLW